MKPYYEKNGITIYHGSCSEMEADAIFLDPPFLIGDLSEYKFKVLYIMCGGHFHHYRERLVPKEVKDWWWSCRKYGTRGEMRKTKEPLVIMILYL